MTPREDAPFRVRLGLREVDHAGQGHARTRAAELLSGTPGGIGPFGITRLMPLPEAPQAGLRAAILAFRLDRPALRGLRRKLRAAKTAGVTVLRGTARPLAAMAAALAEAAEATCPVSRSPPSRWNRPCPRCSAGLPRCSPAPVSGA